MTDNGITTITASEPAAGMPEWALLQRALFSLLNESEQIILEHYLKPDGEIFWPDIPGFVGYGGVDNAFEGFHRWPLFYLLGGDERWLGLAQRQYEVLVAQFSRYRRPGSSHGAGRDTLLVSEYLPDMDWMHAGEAALYFYYLNLANPTDAKNLERSIRFAGFLLDEDPDIPSCYDPDSRVFRTLAMGSNGPAYDRFDRPYSYGTWMDGCGLPFYDVPEVTTLLDLQDPEKARRYGEVYTARLKQCDTVTNMLSMSMLMNAYLHTGDEKYRQRVLDYVEGWRERYAGSGGIMPDNAGPNGVVGETMDGKWYGGHYGWTFPHGFQFVADAMVIGGQSERLLTGAEDRLRWVREQVEMLLCHAIEDDDGRLLVPMKYADPDAVIEYRGGEPLTRPDRVTDHPGFNRKKQVDGWFEFRQVNPSHMAHVWADSLDPEDLEVARRTRDPSSRGGERLSGQTRGKDFSGEHNAWLSYLEGGFPDFPAQALQQGIDKVYAQLQKLRGELDGSETGWGYRPYGDRAWDEVREVTKQVNEMKSRPWTESVTHSYFQTYMIGRSTMATEALVQLTMGGPQPIYNGGLLKVPVRHFDAEQKRAGLPADVAALVSAVDRGGIDLTLANTHPHEERRLIVQAGAFAEHRFTRAVHTVDGADRVTEVNGEYVEFALGPGTVLDVRLGMERYCRQPSYQEPWDR